MNSVVGRVVGIWCYPVKSMLGEALRVTEVTERGVVGDRAFALIDSETGKVVSAKNPRRWPHLFAFHAAYAETPREAPPPSPVWITLPGGERVRTDQADVEARLSESLGRGVRLAQSSVEGATAEGYWPDHDWLAQRDEVFEFPLPPGTFFDGATVHLITTATLDRLQSMAPASRFDAARFRPNFVVRMTDGSAGFVENDWVGRTLAVGDVGLRIDGPCPRCVMTTLEQGNLPKDPGVLRAAFHQNDGNVGAYATIVRAGQVCLDDVVKQL